MLVIDVQNDIVGDAWRRDDVIENINKLVAKASETQTPVIWVQHSDRDMEIGSEAWQIVPELKPLSDENIIRKQNRSSFEETVLDETLAELQVGHLFISSAQSDNCVRHTSHAALERGYDVTFVDEINRSFDGHELPGRSASIISTMGVSFENVL